MAMSFDAFFWSLTQQESGGNYGALGIWLNMDYGRDRAYGRYQVMGANVPSWTRKYYGRELTPQQFLSNRDAQDKVARGRLNELVKKYGYRGAASAWYSGNPNLHMSTRAQRGGPSIKGYVDSVMSRAGRYAGQSTTGGGSGYTAGGPTVPKLDMATMAEMFGLSAALVKSSKELQGLFKKAVAGDWAASEQGRMRFQAELKNTKWWKTQSSTLRKYLTTKYTDPATWKQQNQATEAKLNALAVQIGLGSQIGKGYKLTQLLRDAVYKSRALGWTDDRIKDWMGAKVTTHGGQMWGEAGEAFDKLHELAYLNGMRYSQWFVDESRRIVSGKSTLQNAEAKIRREAAARYGAFSDQIKAGQNVLDLASPYIKSMAQLLELNENDLNLYDRHISKAMTYKGPGGTTDSYSLWQFENDVRNDPRWRKTNNARESMMTVARQVAKDFGLAY